MDFQNNTLQQYKDTISSQNNSIKNTQYDQLYSNKSLNKQRFQSIDNNNSNTHISKTKNKISTKEKKFMSINIQNVDDFQTIAIKQEEQQQQHQLGTIFKNSKTNVKFTYSDQVNTFIITKKILNTNDKINDECKTLNQLKDKKITLDILSINEQDNSFDQIAGKADFFALKKKHAENQQFFELCFLTLLEKLQRLHDLNLAHSDIKPLNIVLSFDNEPFFIDFDSSVQLQNYKYYLKRFTPFFNLDKYCKKVQINGEKKFQIKEFENEEEVKLCDKTQLALTFLYLFCNNQYEEKIFYEKKFNELIELLFKSQAKNSKTILSIISKILNQADNEIQIVEPIDGQQILIFDDNLINEELKKSDAVLYDKIDKKSIYIIQQIDQNRIKQIYLLDCLNCKICIDPDKIEIIPQPQMKEYQYICFKYNQIQKHHNKLIKGLKLDEIRLHNLCEYIKLLKNKECIILLKDENQLQTLLKVFSTSKYLDTLQIILQFNEEFLFDFVKILQSAGSVIESIKLDQQQINCKIIQKINSVQEEIILEICLEELFPFEKTDNYKYIKDNFQIKQIQITFKNEYSLYKQIQKLLQHLIINQEAFMNKENTCLLNIYLKGGSSFNECKYELQILIQLFENQNDQQNFQCSIQKFDNILKMDNLKKFQQQDNFYKVQKQDNIYKLLNLDLSKLVKFQHVTTKNYQTIFFRRKEKDQSFHTNLKKVLCQFVENLLLQQLKKIETIQQIITFKFFNFLFFEEKLWLDFVEIVKNNENQQIEIILAFCEFTENVVEILNNIKNNFSFVKYEIVEEFDNYLKDLQTCQIQYKIDTKQIIEQASEYRLKIKFFKITSRKQFEESREFNNYFQSNSNGLVENNEDQQFEIIIAYCQFTQSIIDILEEIEQLFIFVKKFNVEHGERIIYFALNCRKQNSFLDLRKKLDTELQKFKITNIQHYQYYKFYPNSHLGCVNNQIHTKEEQDYKNQNYDKIDIKSIRNSLSYKKTYKIPFLQKLNILIGKQNQLIYINKKNKVAEHIKDIKDLEFVLADINNKAHYKHIKINLKSIYFSYLESQDSSQNQKKVKSTIEMKIDFNCLDGDISSYYQLFQLYQAIFDNYDNIFSIFDRQELEQIKDYGDLSIQQFCRTNCKKSEQDQEFFQFNRKSTTLDYIFTFKNQKLNAQDQKDLIRASIHKKELACSLIKFQAEYCFSKQMIYMKDKDYIEQINLCQLNLGDETFKVLFEQLENIFSQKRKKYLFEQCNLTVQSLYFLYDIIKPYKENNSIKLDFTNNNFGYLEFKQFIIDCVIEDNSTHEFIFEIYHSNSDEKISQFIKNEFKEQFQKTQKSIGVKRPFGYYSLKQNNDSKYKGYEQT